jgi:predicted MFS family arabinose efflux permease
MQGMANTTSAPSIRTILICGGLILTLSMGIRHGFGLWLQPMVAQYGWSRETFSFALAIQNLIWGASSPWFGLWADRYGAMRVILIGAALYAVGLAGMAMVTSGMGFALAAGIAIGFALSGLTYTAVYGVIGRQVPADQRSSALGIAAAAGSFGQFLMVPVEQWLISNIGWDKALYVLAALILITIPLGLGLREPKREAAAMKQSASDAIKEAFSNKSMLLLTAGYFVCGFQVVFIGVHLPSYIKDVKLPADTATLALGLIGLFNVIGTYVAGKLGQHYPKRYLLSSIYLARAIVITLFLLAPKTAMTVYVFASAMGLLWLSTVPLTNGVIAGIFGPVYLSMLGGAVFFSHQVGSFAGVWMGGKLYDLTGSYDVMWYVSIALGVFAALINLPVSEQPVTRAQGKPA